MKRKNKSKHRANNPASRKRSKENLNRVLDKEKSRSDSSKNLLKEEGSLVYSDKTKEKQLLEKTVISEEKSKEISNIQPKISEPEVSEMPETPITPEVSVIPEVPKGHKARLKKMPAWLKVAGITVSSLLLLGIILVLTPFGRKLIFRGIADYAQGQMNYPSLIVTPMLLSDDIDENAPVDINKRDRLKVDSLYGARQEDYVVNILLLGEEAEGSYGSRGRTDQMIIATLNTKEKSMKLTTLMRDMLVSIPGYQENKLNSAYAVGGIPLLYQTIELNFKVMLDGYMMVGFDDFEKIIDMLEGVDITLSQAEATYLNHNAYVTEVSNRNLKAGVNHMNGDQALGYCRIRYVGTPDHEYNDFGRTSRQKKVLNSIFERYKSLSYVDMLFKLNECLPLVRTDLRSSDLAEYMELAFEIGFSNEIQNFRIPIDGGYSDGYVRQMSVLIPDLGKNTEALHTFIFGEYISAEKEEGEEQPNISSGGAMLLYE